MIPRQDASMPRRRGKKIQGWSADYDKWRIEQLIDLGLETSENSFVARVVREWLEAKEEEHARVGLTLEAFLEYQRAKGSAKLFKLTPKARPEQHDSRRRFQSR
jgi:hypothetical protein